MSNNGNIVESAYLDGVAHIERLEYRRRHAAASKLQRLWRTRRDSRMNELEKKKRVKVHEVCAVDA